MAFQDRAQGVCSRLHLTSARRPALIGIAVLLGLLLAGILLFMALPQGGSVFEVKSSAVSAEEGPAEEGGGSSGDGAGVSAEAMGDRQAAPPSEASDDVVLSESGSAEAVTLCIHVDGKVARPGVYYLEEGSRVIDAVDAAGGLADGAVTESVNLAQPLSDGQQVVIPDFAASSAGAPGDVSAEGAAGASSPMPALVSINTASTAELTTLKGVGEATAEKIVAYREAQGPFKSLEDLKRVSGIGDKKFEALRDSICL